MSGAPTLADATVLITGATDGLGRALALDLARAGARVLVHGRAAERCAAVLDELRAIGARDPAAFVADFADLRTVPALVRQVLDAAPVLDVVVSNAGVGIGRTRAESVQGHELSMQVNALAGDVLIRGLVPALARAPAARVVLTASAGQWPLELSDLESTRGWHGAIAYGRSKLAQIMLGFELAQELEPQGITVCSAHPASAMPTKLVIGLIPPQSELADGVRTLRYLIEAPELAGVTGRYFDRMQEARANDQAYDPAARAALRAWAAQATASLG